MHPGQEPLPPALSRDYLGDEAALIRAAAAYARLPPEEAGRVTALTTKLVEQARAARPAAGLDAFLREYSLDSREGVILLCLAESLLRIPDAHTADQLIAEKLRAGDWAAHAGDSDSLFVNASTWSLMLGGRLVGPVEQPGGDPVPMLQRLVSRLGEPLVRAAMGQAMRILGTQFVLGRSIDEALRRARAPDAQAYLHSFDMLGEAALTWPDARRHFDAYREAIEAIARDERSVPAQQRSGISVKLSALHPRYEFQRSSQVLAELVPQVRELAARAVRAGVSITLDAEESDRLELQLAVLREVLHATPRTGQAALGLAVQAYQRRAGAVLDWLVDLAVRLGQPLHVRLVKGAYWDTEIKRAQERGLPGYPVYTRKVNTDVAWLACARRLLAADATLIHPQFATHNAHAVAYVLTVAAGTGRPFEFQRLHGMGRELYDQLVQGDARVPCRVYAPVGSHAELLPYLVRRLLENGANASFVHRLADARLPVADIVRDPVDAASALQEIAHPLLPDPPALFGSERRSAAGINFADARRFDALLAAHAQLVTEQWRAHPSTKSGHADAKPVCNPARRDEPIGIVVEADASAAQSALTIASAAFADGEGTPAVERAACLRRAADLFEADASRLMAMAIREAGKTWPNALGEVREAVDFLRYYAAQAEQLFAEPRLMPGPTGERNELWLRGRGVFVCISPWNFPLAIFTGQVAAALAAGNTVIAKPAEQTPLIAAHAVSLLHAAGIPREVVSLLPGDGEMLGKALLSDARVAGVAFTGSTDVAQYINRQLAARPGALAVLIAETGGQNAIIADSSALAEQVVIDAAASAFDSAGQRCSAARLLLLQEEIAERTIELLRGFMDTLIVGDPALPETDIGPVIDAQAREQLQAHVASLAPRARWLHRVPLAEPLVAQGHFFAPVAMEIDAADLPSREVFGPVLHVIRYRAADRDAMVDRLNALGYGLTLGVQTRIDATAARIAARARVGNIYVNRNIIGAVVGVQPFGGRGLSGTGPKAGGPHYLPRFATELTLTTNTAAVGGNASLLAGDRVP